ncbi:MAG TPA: hypothetical protein VGI40_12560 [Pirellulaceae bacterium]|jgi:hypothetical protein
MKRTLLQLLAITLLLAGGICTTAQAQSPYQHHRNYAVTPAVVVYGGNGGYGAYGNNYGGYGNGYGGGYGYAPYVAPIYPQTAPYGAGYVGGYRPYQDMYYQRLYYGLGF